MSVCFPLAFYGFMSMVGLVAVAALIAAIMLLRKDRKP